MILPTLSASEHCILTPLETTVSQNEQLTRGELGVYTTLNSSLSRAFGFVQCLEASDFRTLRPREF
jgi:hypothetical protein